MTLDEYIQKGGDPIGASVIMTDEFFRNKSFYNVPAIVKHYVKGTNPICHIELQGSGKQIFGTFSRRFEMYEEECMDDVNTDDLLNLI